MIEKREFSVLSTDGIHTLKGVVYLPQGDAKGFFHAVHGMTEHIGRYDRFLSDMASDGWISFGYDNLGHGKTVNDDSELGYIAEKNGYDILARDVSVFANAVIEHFSDKRLPYALMGHSMGSFISRLAVQKYVKPERLILMGTGGKNGAANAAIALDEFIKLFKGEHHVSPLLNTLAFGGYNKKFGKATKDDPKLWLSCDESVRRAYNCDKFCTFDFTLSAMGDLIRLIKYTNCADWYREIPRDMPILLVSGNDDPVGNYGKGVMQVEKCLKGQKCPVECKLYKGARHEILNDFTYGQVLDDIKNFLSAIAPTSISGDS